MRPILSKLPCFAAFLILTQPALAQSYFETQRAFRIDRDCVATPAPRLTADATAVTTGQMFVARGIDRQDRPRYVFVRIGEVNRWVALACGAFTDDDSAAR